MSRGKKKDVIETEYRTTWYRMTPNLKRTMKKKIRKAMSNHNHFSRFRLLTNLELFANFFYCVKSNSCHAFFF